MHIIFSLYHLTVFLAKLNLSYFFLEDFLDYSNLFWNPTVFIFVMQFSKALYIKY